MSSWGNVAFMHLALATYFAPPDLVCLMQVNRDLLQTYGTTETYRAVAKSFFGSAAGPRGHLSRRQRRKKGVWRPGDGAKARLSLLWLERTRNNVLQLQNAHLLQQREHERRWVLQQAAAVMRLCAYGLRQKGGCCSHSKLRLWTSANIVARKHSSSCSSQERPASHHGVRCNHCKKGPITGSCFRCAAGCCANTQGPQGDGHDGSGSAGAGGGCYTLCEACFPARRRFHPPHPFARLSAGFGESRLSRPALYEAVCGDCSFGSLVLVRPLRTGEAFPGDPGSETGDVWAVPIRVEAAGPLPLSQVKSRIAAGDRDDNRGLAFASQNWRLRQPEAEEEVPVDPEFDY